MSILVTFRTCPLPALPTSDCGNPEALLELAPTEPAVLAEPEGLRAGPLSVSGLALRVVRAGPGLVAVVADVEGEVELEADPAALGLVVVSGLLLEVAEPLGVLVEAEPLAPVFELLMSGLLEEAEVLGVVLLEVELDGVVELEVLVVLQVPFTFTSCPT